MNRETDKQVKYKSEDMDKGSSARKSFKGRDRDKDDLHRRTPNESDKRDDDELGMDGDDQDDPRGIDRYILLLENVTPFD